jgi:hypothetical protein
MAAIRLRSTDVLWLYTTASFQRNHGRGLACNFRRTGDNKFITVRRQLEKLNHNSDPAMRSFLHANDPDLGLN